MMERETPPPSPTHEAGDAEVSSRRSPDLPKPEVNPSAALHLEHLATTRGDGKSLTQFDVRPDILTGLMERVALSEEHRSLMSMVLTKISSATSGLNEAFTSLLKSFEVCSEKMHYFFVVKHALGVLPMVVAPETLVARHRRQTGDHIVMVVLYMCAGI